MSSCVYKNRVRYFKAILFGIFFLCSKFVDAQKPILNCIKRDTLLWSYGANTCGTTNTRIIVYGARNQNGPYSIVDSVAASATSYAFNNPDGNAWYFFLVDRNSSGVSCYMSDTLSNQPPQLNPVLTLNVLSKTSVEVRWRKNPSAQVVGYIIYKKTVNGLVPIAKINNPDTVRYVDANANPTVISQEYQVLAVDQCGSTSLFDQNHLTILLKAQQNRCQQAVTLSWNLYKTWSFPIARHEIWVSQGSRNPYLLTTVGGRDTTFTFNKLQDKTTYSFFVRAVQASSGITARSNDTVFVSDVIVPVGYLFLKNATVNANNSVQMYWNVNATAKVDSMIVLRSDSNSTAFNTIGVLKLSLPLNPQYTFNDSSVNTRKPNFYRIVTHDVCGTFDTSNIIGTVSLLAQPNVGRLSKLFWSPFDFDAANITGYQVTRFVKNIPTDIGLPLDITARTYTDNVGADEPNICYRIGTNFTYQLPDGTSEDATSYSNISCTEQISNIIVPNAFTPNGKNPEFKAYVLFPENIANYQILISDRWGGTIFSSTDFTAGWDGRRGLTELPQGVYLYYIRATQKNGNIIEKTGGVLLLR